MADSGQEFSGRSVDEAIAEGLAKLGLRSNQVEIEVLNRGSRGIFGLGSEPARVRITRSEPAAPKAPATSAPATPAVQAEPPAPSVTQTPDPTPPPVKAEPAAQSPQSSRQRGSNLMDDEGDDGRESEDGDEAETVSDEELATMAIELLNQLVTNMGFEAQVNADWQEADDNGERYLLLDIQGEDVSPLIGRRGETLASIQYLVRLMINQRIKRWKNIVVDVEQYKERRVNQLTQLAKRMADQVEETGRAVSLEPMPANERRIVHLALRDHPAVYTQSSGEGERRKVHIAARA